MQIGSIYKGSEHYGGHHHDLGLFRVAKLGKKFASLREIKYKSISDTKEYTADGLQSSGSTKCRACLPIKDVPSGKFQFVSFDVWNEEDDCAYVPNGGSGCTKIFERVLPDTIDVAMCECSGVVYMENSEYCHECGEKFRVCENCKVNSRYNKGKFCHMCGTCFEKMEKKEPLHQVEEKKKSKDSQFLALVYLIGIQNPHEIFKTLIELLMEECYYSMPRCEKELQDMWHMRSVISTQQLIDIQLFKIGTQSRDMGEVKESIRVIKNLRSFLELETKFQAE